MEPNDPSIVTPHHVPTLTMPAPIPISMKGEGDYSREIIAVRGKHREGRPLTCRGSRINILIRDPTVNRKLGRGNDEEVACQHDLLAVKRRTG